MLKPSDFNNAVPQFQNGNYASNPINPQYVEEPSSTDYNRGSEPLQTLPAQWWNWFMNKFTSRFNKVNIYVKNLFNELAQLLSLVNVTPDGTEGAVTDGQLKNAFKELYPTYVSNKLKLGTTYVKKTQKINNHALSGDVNVTKSDVGLGNVPNVSTNDQTPTYTKASALTALSSGEKLSIAFGKLAKAVSSLISHIANVSNPHSVTKAQVGLGSVVNTGDSATPVENGTTKFTTGGAYTLKKDLTDIAESLPTDAVLHYSFDEVPDYPDGIAVYKKDNDFTDTTGWTGSATISTNNGKLHIQNTTTSSQVAYYNLNIPSNSIYVISGIANLDCTININIRHDSSSPDVRLKVLTLAKGQHFKVIMAHASSAVNFSISGTQFDIDISTIYIGNGSYSTPIIDNANRQNNATNNGILPVKGVSGKGAYLLKGKNATIDGTFQITKNFSISVWVKPEERSLTYGVIFAKNNVMYLINGRNWNSAMVFGLYGENSVLVDNLEIASIIENRLVHIAITRAETTLKIYIDGILSKTVTLSDGTIATNSNNCSIGSPDNTKNQMIDDLLIFDRALTENEVTALYLNKANTPKFYDINNYILDNPDTTPIQDSKNIVESGGVYTELAKKVNKTTTVNGHALSGNVTVTKGDVGLGNVANKDLSNVENTGDSAVPAKNGITKFTTGGAFDFFGETTNSKTWLSRVFGWALGRSWKHADVTIPNCSSIQFLRYINGKYFALSEDIRSAGLCIWTSVNLHTWSQGNIITPGVSGNIQIHEVIYNNGLYVAISNKGVYYSEDSNNWSLGTGLSTVSYIQQIDYNNGLWVAAGYSNAETAFGSWWSTDGKNWNQGTTSDSYGGRGQLGIKYANGIWVIVGDGHWGAWWSTDGKAWTHATGLPTSSEGTHFSNVNYVNGLWVIGGYSFRGDPSIGLWWSIDGKAWTQGTGTYASSINVELLSYINGLWIAGSHNDLGMLVSTDGKAWTQIQQVLNSQLSRVLSVSFANGTWGVLNMRRIDSNNFYYSVYVGNTLNTLYEVTRLEVASSLTFLNNMWLVCSDTYEYSDYSVLIENGYLI